MKLRTKITLIIAAVLLTAVAVNDAMIWANRKKSLYAEAEQTAFQRMYALKLEYENYSQKLENNLSDTERTYFFKSFGDDFTICYHLDEAVYNNTVFTRDELVKVIYNSIGYDGNSQVSYGYIEKNGTNLLVTHAFTVNNTSLYQLTDIKDIDVQLNRLMVAMLGISLAIIIPVMILLYVLTGKALKPLSKLSESAKGIANGAYHERVDVIGNDEVGQLTDSFNTMAEAVETKISELYESEKRKTMFMADFSHELKTPLTAISGYAQTMLKLRLSEEERVEALSYIHSESNRLDRLSRKMKRLLELDNTAELNMEVIPVSRLFEEAVKTCQPVASNRNIKIIQIPTSARINGDFDLLHDVLCNLIDNAIKASRESQTIELYTRDNVIVVSDSGCGIPSEEIDRITEPFYMVDKSRSRQSGGAGIGLSLVSKILRIHDMKMTIESEINVGTKINLHFVDVSVNT